MKKKFNTVIDTTGPNFLCKDCKAVEKINLPMDVKQFALAGKVFAKKHRKCGLKSCLTCKHLEWVDGDVNDPSGFTCNKRLDEGLTEKQESNLLKKLESEKYLKLWKPCFEAKEKHD